ncbi:hypothetical protein EC973_001936 [Apophysomyces ossiformis]|uniref:Gfd2/YDR514C-like C-terminal domain-containing protein n=1 Tax=Apophysomyces ossiformis TaxID=679940 RepID=A0A8H7BTV6_9FUNG|nr:hypothetical protein EC973_001936 [Apophysomyces ossiformis]
MSAGNYYFQWKDIQNSWFQQYRSYNFASFEALRDFFDPKNFFAPNAKTTGIILHAGVDTDGVWFTLITPSACSRLRQILSEYLISKVGATVPVPIEPLNPRTYTDIKFAAMTDRNVYQRWLRNVSKANKGRERMQEAKNMWKQAKSFIEDKQYVLFSIDIEAWEQDHSVLLEIGWSMYDTRNDQYMDQHYLVDTYRHLQNGKYVDDHKLRFQFGTSVWCTLKQALEEFKKDLDWATQRDSGFVLVGHGLDSDLKYLQQHKFLWPGHAGEEDILDVNKSALVAILNTDTIYAASISNLHNPPSLGKILAEFEIEHWCLHNAGNDAHYTMELLMALIDRFPTS